MGIGFFFWMMKCSKIDGGDTALFCIQKTMDSTFWMSKFYGM